MIERNEAADAIGLYVHTPFCPTKCGYCDFYSLPTIPAMIPGLIGGIARELSERAPQRPVRTIFVGGGTPTELPADALDELLTAIGRRPRLADAEWTVEANPSSASELKLDLLRRHGVNRISFGAQSFFEDELAVLERIHDPARIGESVRAARRAGFENLNLDLIYGIPGQSLERWRASLSRAIELGPDHISCYALMYEPKTSLTRLRDQGRIAPCDESLEVEMFELTHAVLAAAGYEQYEISNYARPGRRCAANLIYWRNEEYLGVGPSAVSYLDGVRQKNIPDVRAYVDGSRGALEAMAVETERLTPTGYASETAVQMLRLIDGIDCGAFAKRSGFDPHVLFADAIAEMTAAGLILASDTTIQLTRRGLLLSNYVMRAFLDANDESAPRRTNLVSLTITARG